MGVKRNICIKRYLCMSVCVWCVCTHTEGMKYAFINIYICSCGCAFTCGNRKQKMLGIFDHLPLVLRQDLPVNLKLIDLMGLANYWASRICQSLLLLTLGLRHICVCVYMWCVFRRFEFSSPFLNCRHFTDWAVNSLSFQRHNWSVYKYKYNSSI